MRESGEDSARLSRIARRLKERADFGSSKLRVQGQFKHRGESYGLWVTDPIERTYKAKGEGEYRIGECRLTVSIGEPYKGNCYKLIAAIIPKP